SVRPPAVAGPDSPRPMTTRRDSPPWTGTWGDATGGGFDPRAGFFDSTRGPLAFPVGTPAPTLRPWDGRGGGALGRGGVAGRGAAAVRRERLGSRYGWLVRAGAGVGRSVPARVPLCHVPIGPHPAGSEFAPVGVAGAGGHRAAMGTTPRTRRIGEPARRCPR